MRALGILLLLAAPAGAAPALDAYLGTPAPDGAAAWLSSAAAAAFFDATAAPRAESLRLASAAVERRALEAAGLASARERAALLEAEPALAELLLELERYEDKEYPLLGDEGPYPAFDLLARRLPGGAGRPDWSAARGSAAGTRSVAPPSGTLRLGRLLAHSAMPADSDWALELPAARRAPEPPPGGSAAARQALSETAALWARGGAPEAAAACRADGRLDYAAYEPWLLPERGLWYRAKFLPLVCSRDHARCVGHMAARAAGSEDDPTGDGKGCDEAPYHLWLASVAEGKPAEASCGAFVQKIYEERGFLSAHDLAGVCAGMRRALEGGSDLSFCAAFARSGRPAGPPEAGEDPDPDSAEAACRGLSTVSRGPAACAALDGPWRRICLVGALTWEAAHAKDARLCRDSKTCLAAVQDASVCGPRAAAAAREGVCAAFARRVGPRLDAAYQAAFERAWTLAGPAGRRFLERLSETP
jgi:hypothetical protein